MKPTTVTIALILRHILGALGGYLVGKDLLSADQAAGLTELLVNAAGGIGTLGLAVLWSWLQKRGKVPV